MPARGQWRAIGDAPRRLHHLVFQAIVVDDPGNEVFRLRFERRQDAPLEQDFLSRGLAAGVDQQFHQVVRQVQADILRRNTEAPRHARDAQIAGQRQFEAAAQTKAVDHGDYRMPARVSPDESAIGRRTVGTHFLAGGPLLFETADIGAGAKRFRSGTAQNNAAQAIVLTKAVERIANCNPIVLAQRIALFRTVNRDHGDVVTPLDQNRFFHKSATCLAMGRVHYSPVGARLGWRSVKVLSVSSSNARSTSRVMKTIRVRRSSDGQASSTAGG